MRLLPRRKSKKRVKDELINKSTICRHILPAIPSVVFVGDTIVTVDVFSLKNTEGVVKNADEVTFETVDVGDVTF